MIIDIHTHIDRANNQNWTPEQLIASMDEAGIDLSLVISNNRTDAPLEKMLAYAKDNARFRVIGNVIYESFSDEQVDMLISHLEEKRIIGVKLYPGYEDYYPYDEKFDRLLAYCQKNNHPLVVHTGVLMKGVSGFLEQAHPLHIDRIATKFPDLKIVMAHMGNPWLVDTVAVMWRHPHVYTDFSAFFDEFKPIKQHEIDCFYDRMKDTKALLGSFKRVMFGTDWPLYSQKAYLDVIDKLPFTEEERELVFWKNANTVFNLGL